MNILLAFTRRDLRNGSKGCVSWWGNTWDASVGLETHLCPSMTTVRIIISAAKNASTARFPFINQHWFNKDHSPSEIGRVCVLQSNPEDGWPNIGWSEPWIQHVSKSEPHKECLMDCLWMMDASLTSSCCFFLYMCYHTYGVCCGSFNPTNGSFHQMVAAG